MIAIAYAALGVSLFNLVLIVMLYWHFNRKGFFLLRNRAAKGSRPSRLVR